MLRHITQHATCVPHCEYLYFQYSKKMAKFTIRNVQKLKTYRKRKMQSQPTKAAKNFVNALVTEEKAWKLNLKNVFVAYFHPFFPLILAIQ